MSIHLKALEERRMALLTIQPELLVEIFNAYLTAPVETALRPDMPEGIPEDLVFGACHYDYPRQQFDLVVYHPDFPRTPEGSMLNRVGQIETWSRYRLVDGKYQKIV